MIVGILINSKEQMEPIPEKRRVKQNGVIENENELMNKQKMLIC